MHGVWTTEHIRTAEDRLLAQVALKILEATEPHGG